MRKSYFIIVLIGTMLQANQSLDAKKFCDDLIVTKNYLNIPYNPIGNLLVSFAQGGLSIKISQESYPKNSNYLYIAGTSDVNKVMVKSCSATNKDISKMQSNYYRTLELKLIDNILKFRK